MKSLLKIIIAILLCGISQHAISQSFLRADGKKIVNDNGEILLRGMGLGGWVLQEPYMLRLSGIVKTQQELKDSIAVLIGKNRMEEFYEAWWENGIQKRDVDSLAAWGFNSLRMPLHYNQFTLPIEKEPVKGQNTWLEKGFAITDSLLSWCKANRIYLMLDLHAVPGGQGNDVSISDASEVRLWQSEENKQKTIALWRKLVERYVNEPWVGCYDIINEPNYGFQNPKEDKNGLKEKENAPLRELMIEITKAIREVDKNHLIVIEGNGWGNNYNGIFPLWDNNMAISFHKYWNFNNQQSIAGALKNREEQNAPLWMSESGENSNVWFTDAIRLFEKNNIGWSWWTYKKIGIACPMEIISPEGYEKLLDYWSGKGEKPDSEETYRILMQLAENYKIENTRFHRDYIDALFRQVATNKTIPFNQNILKKDKPLTIFAVDYDLGRNSYAYHDNDSANYRTSNPKLTGGNKGRLYRNDAVDIIACTDEKTNGYCVTGIESGEWLQYTINVEETGYYKCYIRFRLLNNKRQRNTSKLYFSVNGLKAGKELAISAPDDSWGTFLSEIYLKEGENVVRVNFKKGGIDFNWIELIRI